MATDEPQDEIATIEAKWLRDLAAAQDKWTERGGNEIAASLGMPVPDWCEDCQAYHEPKS